MSEKLCALRKIGGTLKETTLWTNSNPTSTFASQTVSLSDDITKYDFIKISYRTSTGINKSVGYLMSLSDFLTITTENGQPRFMLGNSSASGKNWFRIVRRATNTSIYFGSSYNADTSDNAQVIPIQITGCNL